MAFGPVVSTIVRQRLKYLDICVIRTKALPLGFQKVYDNGPDLRGATFTLVLKPQSPSPSTFIHGMSLRLFYFV